MTRRLTFLVSALAGILLPAVAAFAQSGTFDRSLEEQDAAYFNAQPAGPTLNPADAFGPTFSLEPPETPAPSTRRPAPGVSARVGVKTPQAAATPPQSLVPSASQPTSTAPARPIDNLFLFLCAALVLLMQAGFAMLETGFNSSRHTVNNLFKNVLNLAVAAMAFFLVGYHLMFPVSPTKENYVGQIAPGIDGSFTTSGSPKNEAVAPAGLNPQVHFLYRFALAATAAAIVSGAVAGRMKFGASVICGAVIAGLVYPVVGYWKWGGGWLDDMGFHDFAGAGIVHTAGGFAGLAGAVLLGPRVGRYDSGGRPIPVAGHSLPLATLGVVVILVGFYGFNAAGRLTLSGSGDIASLGLVAVNTTLAGCAGCCLATGLSWVLFARPDLSMALTGLLGGLVAVSAGCDGFTNAESLVVGAVGGGGVIAATILLDKLRIDDPVGAFPVHGVCGMWALLACSFFGDAEAWGDAVSGAAFGNSAAQLTGLIAIAGFSFACMLGVFGVLKSVGFLRVLPEHEEQGLDASEYRMSAYAA